MTHFYQGLMDDIRIYNYALDSLEITKLYNGYLTEVEKTSNPSQFRLALNNYPNPFNPVTKIVYTVPRRGRVMLTVYNVLGQKVAQLVDEVKPAGEYSLLFDAVSMNSGVYLCRLDAGGEQITRKLLLMR